MNNQTENGEPMKKIKDIIKGEKNIEIIVILIKFVTKTTTKNEQKISQFLVGDETGCIQCNFFDETGSKLTEGDIIHLKGAYATTFKTHLVLYSPKQGRGFIEKIGEFFQIFSLTPNLSEREYLEDDYENKKNMKMNRVHDRSYNK